MAPSEAEDSKTLAVPLDVILLIHENTTYIETHEIAMLCGDLFIEALARWLPFVNTMKFSISVASIGGEIGAKCSGKIRGFTGWS